MDSLNKKYRVTIKSTDFSNAKDLAAVFKGLAEKKGIDFTVVAITFETSIDENNEKDKSNAFGILCDAFGEKPYCEAIGN
ncbi:MAG: hypothetical protein WCG84_02970 [Candidatus Moraniibacteriota bacterium]